MWHSIDTTKPSRDSSPNSCCHTFHSSVHRCEVPKARERAYGQNHSHSDSCFKQCYRAQFSQQGKWRHAGTLLPLLEDFVRKMFRGGPQLSFLHAGVSTLLSFSFWGLGAQVLHCSEPTIVLGPTANTCRMKCTLLHNVQVYCSSITTDCHQRWNSRLEVRHHAVKVPFWPHQPAGHDAVYSPPNGAGFSIAWC